MKIKGLSGIFNGNIMGENMNKDVFGLKDAGIELEKNMKRNINFGVEKIAKKRTKDQKNLNLFGDYDKDKVLNIFDCEPLNKKKQGMIHKAQNLFMGKGFKEDIDLVKKEGNQTRVKKTGQYTTRPNNPISTMEELKRTKVGQFIGGAATGIKSAFEKSPEQKAKEMAIGKEREEINQFRSEAKEDAYKQMIRRKTREDFMDEYLGRNQKPSARQNIEGMGDSLRGMRDGGSEAARQLIAGTGAAAPRASSKINELYGIGGQGQGFNMMASPGSMSGRGLQEMSGSGRQGNNMFDAIKKGPTGQGIIEALQTQIPKDKRDQLEIKQVEENPMQTPQPAVQPMQYNQPEQPMQYRQPEQPISQPQIQQQGPIISPYSKKPVRYTRGPYRKTVSYQQYPQ